MGTQRPALTASDTDEREAIESLRVFDLNALAGLLGLTAEPFEQAEVSFAARLVRLEAGDRGEARDFSSRLSECRSMLRNRALRHLLGEDAGSEMQAPSEKDLAELRAGIPRCAPFLQQGDQALRDLLEQWADAGNVAARAVYALWPPHRDLQHPSHATLRHWELRAMEFSLANLALGESLGFHVFAESFRSGLFTPGSPLLSLDFRLASMRCGFSGPENILESLQHLSRHHQYESIPATFLDMLNQRSEQLRAYCRSGHWLGTEAATALIQEAWPP